MSDTKLHILLNGLEKEFNGDARTPLLWVIREHFKLTGTKYGCGIAYCGACTVHLERGKVIKAIRSCVTPVWEVSREKWRESLPACEAKHQGPEKWMCDRPRVTTIEGLAARPARPPVPGLKEATPLHPVQQAWIDEQVPQCGYCQSGQIMSAVALLEALKSKANLQPGELDDYIDQAMAGNLCRCGTYTRIRKAIHRVAGTISPAEGAHE